MAKMLNYRFRYKVTAPFRATFCFEFVTHHMHIKRGDQQWAAAIRSRISLVTSEALAQRCASSLQEAHSRAGSPWTQQNVFFTTECSCEQQAVLYQIQFVGIGLHFILLGFFFSFLHVNISANLSSGFLAAVSLEKKKKIFCDLQNMEMGVLMKGWKQCLQNLVCRCFLATQQSTENATVPVCEEHSWDTGWTTLEACLKQTPGQKLFC